MRKYGFFLPFHLFQFTAHICQRMASENSFVPCVANGLSKQGFDNCHFDQCLLDLLQTKIAGPIHAIVSCNQVLKLFFFYRSLKNMIFFSQYFVNSPVRPRLLAMRFQSRAISSKLPVNS